ncbi:MAG: hypothetical protein IIC55_03105 [Proteobacteria bacterium]|nr:hypothetical protein [Pseudomonadota bacterium]
MRAIEGFMKSFGFTLDPIIIAMICLVVLLVNFAGGMFSNIILAFSGPIQERKITKRTSFRLALVSELFLIVYVIYYHVVLVGKLDPGQIIFWVFTLIAAPLLAALGAQLTYIAFAAKIEELKKKGKNMDRAQKGESVSADNEDAEDEEEEEDED